MKKTITLSKSKIMSGIQCQKLLYLSVHNKELAPPVSQTQQATFDQGHEVGFLAQKLFSGGILIEAEYWDTNGAFEKTLTQIKKGAETLFEATIVFDGVSARADIFKKTSNGWEIIEVKSSTYVKDEHLDDAGIQLWVFRKHGLKVEKISIMHIDNKYVRSGNLATRKLFKIVDVTEEVKEKLKDIPKLVKKLKTMLEGIKAPKIDIGSHCNSPYECPYKDHCWKHIPVPSAFDIPRIGARVWDLYKDNNIEIKKLEESDFNPKQARAIKVLKSGKRFVDGKLIKEKMSALVHPIYFLDFETFNPAIPLYEATRPYQQIPFQFSCHILDKKGVPPRHFEYLHLDNSDPREALAKALVDGFGDIGSVVAYNRRFEAGVLKDLAEIFPNHRKKLLSISERLVDPWPVLEASVYDKEFLGSYSLKSVAPALLGDHMSYEGMVIDEGGGASLAYHNLIKDQLSKTERKELIQAMLVYCRQDTMATVELVEWLYEHSS